jgi:hypothetical protein
MEGKVPPSAQAGGPGSRYGDRNDSPATWEERRMTSSAVQVTPDDREGAQRQIDKYLERHERYSR